MTLPLDRIWRCSSVVIASVALAAMGVAHATPPCDCAHAQYGDPCSPGYPVDNGYWDQAVNTTDPDLSSPFPPPAAVSDFESLCHGMYHWDFHNPIIEQYPGPSTNCDPGWFPGYPLNIDLKFGPAAGTFPPLKLAPILSSSPLIASPVAHFRGPAAYAERPTLLDSVDLITGVPLLQEVDFSLPLGSSQFRWVRTYSEYPGQFDHEYDAAKNNHGTDGSDPFLRHRSFKPQQMFWDWVGQGWMIGVNPIFFFDSTSWGSVDGQSKARCYFMPDAHHAIPFDYVDGTENPPRYEAPPRFDALLAVQGGVFDKDATSGGPWQTYPTAFKLWMHNKSVVYTIKPVCEDVGIDFEGDNLHNPPDEDWDPNRRFDAEAPPNDRDQPRVDWYGSTGGASMGVPFYGVVTDIQDASGNRIHIEYCDFERVLVNDARMSACSDYSAVWQKGQQKGQIKRIQLFTGGDDEQPTWTIIPIYRQFGGNDSTGFDGAHNLYGGTGLYVMRDDDGTCPPGLADYLSGTSGPQRRDRFETQRAIASLFVYEGGGPELPSGSNGLTIPETEFDYWDVTDPGETRESLSAEEVVEGLYDALTHEVPDSLSGSLPTGWDDWVHKVNYLYADGTALYYRYVELLGHFDEPGSAYPWENPDRLLQSPRLLLTKVNHKTKSETPAKATSEFTVYRYANRTDYGYTVSGTDSATRSGKYDLWTLEAVWRSSTLTSLRRFIETSADNNDQQLAERIVDGNGNDRWPLPLFAVAHDSDTTLPKTMNFTSGDARQPLLRFADLQMEAWWSAPAGSPLDFAAEGTGGAVSSAFLDEMMGGSAAVPGMQGYIASSGGGQMDAYFASEDGPAIVVDRSSGNAPRTFRLYRFVARPGGSTPGRFAIDSDPDDRDPFYPTRAMLHEPFLQIGAASGGPDPEMIIPPGPPNLADPCWVSIIDEYEHYEHATVLADWPVASEDPHDGTSTFWDGLTVASLKASSDRGFAPLTRRLMLMNAAGYVLLDRTWNIAEGTTASSSGLYQQLVYDWDATEFPNVGDMPWGERAGRIIEKRSYSWSAAEAAGEADSHGLIEVYDYDDRSGIEPTMDIGAVGVKQGREGAVVWKKQYVRDAAERDLVKLEIEFTQPTTAALDYTLNPANGAALAALTTAGKSVTARAYAYVVDEDTDTRRITHQLTIRPPGRVSASSDPYFPVEVTYIPDWAGYLETTNPFFVDTWKGYGLVPASGISGLDDGIWDPVGLDTSDAFEFALDLSRRDTRGFASIQIVDCSLADLDIPVEVFKINCGMSSGAPTQDPALLAPDWARAVRAEVADTTFGEPANAWTYSEVDRRGPSIIASSNSQAPSIAGEFYAYEREQNPPSGVTVEGTVEVQRHYKRVTYTTNGVPIDPFDPGQITYSRDGEHLLSQKVRWTSFTPGADLAMSPALFEVVAAVTVERDGNGAPAKVAVSGSDGTSVAAQAQVGRFGEIARELAPDGTITRTVSDSYGRPERIFRGTNDLHAYWGTAEPCETPPCEYDDNLVLIEKRYYGDGVTGTSGNFDPLRIQCAFKLFETRRYRDQVLHQYVFYDLYGEPVDESEEDSLGWAERFGYDWRGRQVWQQLVRNGTPHQMESYDYTGGSGGDVISHTFTYYDNADRPVLIATYGDTAPSPSSGVDPRLLGPTSTVTAADLLAASVKPLRLRQTVYNARGQVEEQRDYLVDSAPSDKKYLASITFYDSKDRVIISQSPGGPQVRSYFDFLGNAVRTSAWVTAASTDVELSRTDTVFDYLGNAVETTTYERAHNATANTVDAGASSYVATATYNWYDEAGRVTATADLGAGGSTFSTGTTFPTRDDAPTASGTSYPKTISGGPSGARITLYIYDDLGRQKEVVNPDGTATRFAYNSLGQMTVKTEIGQYTPEGSRAGIRQTAYQYSAGQLISIAAVEAPTRVWMGESGESSSFSWAETAGLQITRLIYGAPVVENDHDAISQHNGWVKAVHFPPNGVWDPEQDPPAPDLTFTYLPDGVVAARTEARGLTHYYAYDERGNLLSATVDPESGTTIDPVDMVKLVAFQYDSLSQLTLATAYNDTDADVSHIIAQNAYAYDALGHLLSEAQQHGDEIGSSSPTISYQWEFATASDDPPSGVASLTPTGRTRLSKMIYPARTGGSSRREVVFDCDAGSTAAIDAMVDRVTRVRSRPSSTGGSYTNIAAYQFMGQSRRVGERLGADFSGTSVPVEQLAYDPSASTPADYGRFDRFGRVQDLHLTSVTSGPTRTTHHRYEYTYDESGSRVTAKTKIRNTAGTGYQDNTRSYLYGYDGLGQLVEARLGALDGGLGMGSPDRDTEWNLDVLGNWIGDSGVSPPDPDAYGQVITFDFDPGTSGLETRYVDHTRGADNRIGARTETDTAGSGTPFDYVYDKAGNLVADEHFIYFYDAWNRLARVNLRGTTDPVEFNEDGTIADGFDQSLTGDDPMLVHYTYDGLGRLIRKQSPQAPVDDEPVIRTERYYYEGVRRIQEVFNDPVGEAEGGGAGFASGGESSPLEGGAEIVDEVEAEQNPGSESSLLSIGLTWVDREFIWAPGGTGGGYVDELVCQFNQASQPFYALRDANYNVVGIVNSSRNLIIQYTFDPYGRPLYAEYPGGGSNPPDRFNRVGHQGLFFDRLDLPGTTPEDVGQVSLQPQFKSHAELEQNGKALLGLYQNRHRTYSPGHGRMLQKDPNATGIPVFPERSYARTPQLLQGPFEAMSHFGDGANTFEYVGSSPLERVDAAGLSWYEDAWDAEMRGLRFLAGAADPSGTIGSMLEQLVNQYGANQSWDIDWALNWLADDSLHTRANNRWIEVAMLIGAANQFGLSFENLSSSSDLATAASFLPRQLATKSGTLRVLRAAERVVLEASAKVVCRQPLQRSRAQRLSQAGHAYDKHPTIAGHAKATGSPSYKNLQGETIVDMYMTNGIAVRNSQDPHQVFFLDPNMSGHAVKVSLSPNGTVFKIDFVGP